MSLEVGPEIWRELCQDLPHDVAAAATPEHNAALLLLLDVGFRRLAVDPDRVREALTRVSEPRKEGSAASISAWQRSKKAARRQAVDVGRKRGGASTPEQSTPATSGVETPDPPTARPSPPAEEPPGDDMASRLKAAKNRARKERLGDLDDMMVQDKLRL